jgi:hypothetical protein
MPDDDTATWLAELRKARASGVLSVKHGDIQTTFRSLAEIDVIIRSLQADIDGTQAVPGMPAARRLVYPRQWTKGL